MLEQPANLKQDRPMKIKEVLADLCCRVVDADNRDVNSFIAAGKNHSYRSKNAGSAVVKTLSRRSGL